MKWGIEKTYRVCQEKKPMEDPNLDDAAAIKQANIKKESEKHRARMHQLAIKYIDELRKFWTTEKALLTD